MTSSYNAPNLTNIMIASLLCISCTGENDAQANKKDPTSTSDIGATTVDMSSAKDASTDTPDLAFPSPNMRRLDQGGSPDLGVDQSDPDMAVQKEDMQATLDMYTAPAPRVMDATFTKPQLAKIKERFLAVKQGQGRYIVTQENIFGDFSYMDKEAEEFREDMKDGVYEKAWTNFSSYQGSIADDPNPFAGAVPTKGVSESIFYAAIKAAAFDDVELARGVFKAIEDRALDDTLDASNGTNRENKTFGTTTRFDHQVSADGHPWFISSGRMSKYIEAYGMVHYLIEKEPGVEERSKTIEAWFKSWADFMFSLCNNRASNGWGSNWRSMPRVGGTKIYDSSSIQPYTHYDQSGRGFNQVTWIQASIGNNRHTDICKMPYIYGIHFNDTNYVKLGHDFFRAWLVTDVFADGTLAEWYRSYSDDPNQGFVYNHVTLGAMVNMAQMFEVAKYNGLPSVTNLPKGYFYDHTTNQGIEDIATNNYPGDPTGGSEKSLFLALTNLSKYYRTPDNGGYLGQRFAINNQLLEGGKCCPYSAVVGKANTYYKDQNLKSFYLFDTTKGYPENKLPGTPGVKSNGAWWQHTHGPWGSYFAHGLCAELEDSVFP